MVDADIYSRLSTAENEFLHALGGGEHDMESFANAWATLQRDLRSAQGAGHLTQEVERFAYSVASRIDIIAGSFLELDKDIRRLTEELHNEVDDMLASSRATEGGPESEDNGDNDKPRPRAPYLPSAYAWLLDNLHNPYPTKETKDFLAQKSDQPTKLIDSWFVDARQRMGWNRIKKHHFHNKRKPLIEAATKYFDDNVRESLQAGLELDLVTMKQTALDMYSHKFFESELASKLNETIPGDRVSKFDKDNQYSFQSEFHVGSKLRTSYPSPRHSLSPSPSCSPSASIVPQALPPHLPQVSRSISPPRKRYRSEDQVDDTANAERSHKRARHEVSTPVTPAQIGLPSPASSQADSAEQFVGPELGNINVSRERSISPMTLPRQGRRRSGSEAQLSFNCPSGHSRLNRLQTVSTPIFSTFQQTEQLAAAPIHCTPVSLPATTPQLPTLNFFAGANSQPTDQQPTLGEESPLEETLPQFSCDFPGSATFVSPDSTGLVDLALYPDMLFADPNTGGDSFSDIYSASYNEPHYPIVASEESGIDIWDVFGYPPNSGASTSLDQCGISSASTQAGTSSALAGGLDFNAFCFGLDSSLRPSLPAVPAPFCLESILNDDTVNNQPMSQAASPSDIAKAVRAAELENLRKQKDLLQARIQSLESQDDGLICA